MLGYAREWAERAGDTAYPEAIRLLITEEQRHSAVLARFMEMNGIPRLERGATDGVFRWMRNIFGSLEVSIAVLVTAEIIAKVYYPALRAATNSTVLQAICEQIEAEGIGHVEFQTEQLARLRIGRRGLRLWATVMLHRLQYYPTVVIIGLSHRKALGRGGLSLRDFCARCRRQFLDAVASMNPQTKDPGFLKKEFRNDTKPRKQGEDWRTGRAARRRHSEILS